MAHRLRSIAAALSIVTASPAAAADESGLAPNAPWTVDYDDDSCALRRTFGGGANQAYLELRRFGPGLSLQAIVASSQRKPRKPTRGPVTFRYRFASDADWRDFVGANTVTLDTGFHGVLFYPVLTSASQDKELKNLLEGPAVIGKSDLMRTIEAEAAAGTDTLTLNGAFRGELSLQLGPLGAPIVALNTCIDELMTHWGIDVEAHKTLTRPAIPVNLPETASMIAYPPKMAQRRMQGVVNIRLAIDQNGRITGCHIQMPLSDPAFEETSCAELQHALDFDPALDKDGKPIASYWLTKIFFLTGSGAPVPPSRKG